MKKNIALVTGGYSAESVISYKTAVTIEANLDREKIITFTLSNYSALLEVAHEQSLITDADVALLQEWRKSPDSWHREKGN